MKNCFMSKNIAILLTDIDESDFAAQYPDDAEKFCRLLQPLRPLWKFHRIATRNNVFPDSLDPFDGFIITGSPASVHDDRPWIPRLLNLIREADDRRIPVFGACFGHQAIAVALGGSVGRNDFGWGLGIIETTFTSFKPWMRPRLPSVRFYAAHNEQVTALPAGATVLGVDPQNVCGAFSIGNHFFATQHHPEITPDYMAGLLSVMRPDLTIETYEAAKQSLLAAAQGGSFAEWIVRFFEYGNTKHPQAENSR